MHAVTLPTINFACISIYRIIRPVNTRHMHKLYQHLSVNTEHVFSCVYLFQFVHVLLYLITNICGCLQLVLPFLYNKVRDPLFICFHCIYAGRKQCGLQLGFQILSFDFQLLVFSHKPFDLFLTWKGFVKNKGQEKNQIKKTNKHEIQSKFNHNLVMWKIEKVNYSGPCLIAVHLLWLTVLQTCFCAALDGFLFFF